jgi:type IV pilus assembly protein PilZ
MAMTSSKASVTIKSGGNSKNSREHQRVPVGIVLSYHTVDHFCSDIATNISMGGVFIKTRKPLLVGTQLRIAFKVPQLNARVEADGVVTHSGSEGGEGGMGIRFSDIDQRALKAIEEMITHSVDLVKKEKEFDKLKAEIEKDKKRRAVKAPPKKAPKKPARPPLKKSKKA